MPRLELLKLLRTPTNTISHSQNVIGPSVEFSGSSYGVRFNIAKTKFIPSGQFILNFDYETNSIVGSFSPFVRIGFNDFTIGSVSFANTSGSKTFYYNITDALLSEFNNSVTEIKNDYFTIAIFIPSATSVNISSMSDISVIWDTSRSEVFENYDTYNGNNVNTIGTIDTLPFTIESDPIFYPTVNLLNQKEYFYKPEFSGINNETFDLVSRALIRVTGSNNQSIANVNEKPCAIEAYCFNKNLTEKDNIIELDGEEYNQKGEVFAWGSSELISYSGFNSYDIELCFVKDNPSNPINFSANKSGRDHVSLFEEGDFYLKGLASGFQINNIEMILYEKNDEYLPFSMFGGNSNYENVNINIKPNGYFSSKKLMKQNLSFWNCSGVT